MDQRVRITTEGKVIVETDNGIIKEGITNTNISGEFKIDSDSVARLLVAISESKIAITTYSHTWYAELNYYQIIDKDNSIEILITQLKNDMKQKDEEINQLKIEVENLNKPKPRNLFKRILTR